MIEGKSQHRPEYPDWSWTWRKKNAASHEYRSNFVALKKYMEPHSRQEGAQRKLPGRLPSGRLRTWRHLVNLASHSLFLTSPLFFFLSLTSSWPFSYPSRPWLSLPKFDSQSVVNYTAWRIWSPFEQLLLYFNSAVSGSPEVW